VVGGSSSAPAVETRVHINDLHTKFSIWSITDHEWKQLIVVVNFFFALRVNENPNKTDCGNISIDPRYMNVEMGMRPLSLISGNISLKF
jgi:hypothetical protein